MKNIQWGRMLELRERLAGLVPATGDCNSDTAIVVLRSSDGRSTNKIFVMKDDGTPDKDAAADVALWHAFQIDVPSVEVMADVLRVIGEDPAAIWHLSRYTDAPGTGAVSDPFRVLSEAKAVEMGLPTLGWGTANGAGTIRRGKENMALTRWVLCDRDFTNDQPPELVFEDLGEWVAQMDRLMPGYAKAGRVDLPSSSSRLIGPDGAPVWSKPSSHHYVLAADVRTTARLRGAVMLAAYEKGLSWHRVNKNGKGMGLWTITDPSCFSIGRPCFDGSPSLGPNMPEGYSIAPPAVTVTPGGCVDLSLIPTPQQATLAKLRKTGLRVTGRGASLAFSDDAGLTADVLIDLGDGGAPVSFISVWLMLAMMPASSDRKIRCQTPFRDSASMAAFVRMGASGIPCLHDVGTATTYHPVGDLAKGPTWEQAREALAGFLKGEDADAKLLAVTACASAIVVHTRLASQRKALLKDLAKLAAFDEADVAALAKEAGGALSEAVAELQTRQKNPDLPTLAEALEAYNDRYAVAKLGGKAAVVGETWNAEMKRWDMEVASPTELATFHASDRATSGKDIVAPFPIWLKWQGRNRLGGADGDAGIVFMPEVSFRQPGRRAMPQGGVFNLWQGFGVQPVAPEDDPDGAAALAIVYDHLLHVISGGDQAKLEYQLDWLAAGLQQPWRTNLPVVCWVGPEGLGKNIVVEKLFRPIWTAHLTIHTDADRMTAQFNSDLAGCCLYVLNEAVWGGDKRKQGIYKSRISDESMTLEKKYFDAVEVRSSLKVLLFSNEDWFAPIGHGDRRHAVFDLSDHIKGDVGYFKRLAAALERCVGVFLHEMLHRDVDEDRMREPPMWESEAAQRASARTVGDVAQFVEELLAGDSLPLRGGGHACVWGADGEAISYGGEQPLQVDGHDVAITHDGLQLHPTRPIFVRKSDVLSAYEEHCQRRSFGKPVGRTTFYNALCEHMPLALVDHQPSVGSKLEQVMGSRQRLFRFEPLAGCRAAYNTTVTHPRVWSEV